MGCDVRLGQLYAAITARAKERSLGPEEAAIAASAGDVEAMQMLKDEGMVLVAQMLLMAECVGFMGSYASNVAVLVHDMMMATRGDAMDPMDVNGRVYCGCGASFCMTLERKAVRDPTKTVQGLINAFKS
mmetsp:Transcript_28078/g.65600  ORF Transcript_28078/g.65600 Transcript_28078/m.65600 type:complete len:130 (-) Transcript_28078:387-776(-)